MGSVEILPVRSTVVALPPLFMADHAFDPATDAAKVLPLAAPFAGFLGGCSAESEAGARRTRNVGLIFCASADFRNSWKSRSSREDMGESLLHHFIGGSMDECGILIDLCGRRIREPNGSAEVSGLDDFKQWHVLLP